MALREHRISGDNDPQDSGAGNGDPGANEVECRAGSLDPTFAVQGAESGGSTETTVPKILAQDPPVREASRWTQSHWKAEQGWGSHSWPEGPKET